MRSSNIFGYNFAHKTDTYLDYTIRYMRRLNGWSLDEIPQDPEYYYMEQCVQEDLRAKAPRLITLNQLIEVHRLTQ